MDKFMIKPEFEVGKRPKLKYIAMIIRLYRNKKPGEIMVVPVWGCEKKTPKYKIRNLVLPSYDKVF